MEVITIICARGGSKRLPRKNVKIFAGRPLIAWTIIQSRACPLIRETYVTTDDEEIADVSREYGATVLMRENPVESLDTTSGGYVYGQTARRLAKEQDFDAAVNLMATSPLLKPGDIDRLITLWAKVGVGVFWAAPQTDTFIYKRVGENMCEPVIRDKSRAYITDAGGGSINSIGAILATPENPADTRIFTNEIDYLPRPYVEMEGWQHPEIDTQWEFDLCEYFFNLYLKETWEDIYGRLA